VLTQGRHRVAQVKTKKTHFRSSSELKSLVFDSPPGGPVIWNCLLEVSILGERSLE